MSRKTFYELFDDKPDCFLAAHLAAFEALEADLRSACAEQRSWPEGVAAGVAAALDFAAADPDQATLIAFAPLAGEPRLTDRALAANTHLLDLLGAGRERCPEAESPGELAQRALLMGVIHELGAELRAGRAEQLPAMAPEFAEILLNPYLGSTEAKRVANAV